jgi:hypothetical protein
LSDYNGDTSDERRRGRSVIRQFLGRAAIRVLDGLGQDVKITVKPTKKAVGEMEVVVG